MDDLQNIYCKIDLKSNELHDIPDVKALKDALAMYATRDERRDFRSPKGDVFPVTAINSAYNFNNDMFPSKTTTTATPREETQCENQNLIR